MAAGRPRIPTSLKKLGGTTQPSRTNKLEPVPEVALPLPPDWLSDRAKEYWAEIGSLLLDMKLISYPDKAALMLLTEALAQWHSVRVTLTKRGRVYELLSDGGKVYKARPEVAMEADLWKRVLRILTEFGLTPASRSKVSALGKDDGIDPFAQMMQDMKG